MSDLLNRINGNKTVIALALLAFVQQFGLQLGMTELSLEISVWVLTGAATGAFAHRIQKGSFDPDKGV
jgi:hypothetical protein